MTPALSENRISNPKQARSEDHRLSDVLHRCALRLISDPSESAIPKCLADFGRSADTCRVFLIRINPEGTHFWVTAEWCREGVPVFADLAGLPTDMIAWTMQRFQRGETVSIPDIDKLPARAALLKNEMKRERNRATAAVPLLTSEGRLEALIGVDETRTPRHWTPALLQHLRRLGELILAVSRRVSEGGPLPGAAPIADTPASVYLRNSSTHLRVRIDDILEIQAQGDYSLVRLTDAREFLELRPLREWETLLPAHFLRVHRSHLVNLAHMSALDRERGGRWWIRLDEQTRIPVGRRFQPALSAHLERGASVK